MGYTTALGSTFRITYVNTEGRSVAGTVAAASIAANPATGGALILAAINTARTVFAIASPISGQPETLRLITRAEIAPNTIAIGVEQPPASP